MRKLTSDQKQQIMYQQKHKERKRGRQLTICFEPGLTLTLAMFHAAVESLMAESVQPVGKNYTFFVHPEMVKEVDKLLGIAYDDNGGTHENTAKAVSDEDAFPDYLLDNTPTGTDFL